MKTYDFPCPDGLAAAWVAKKKYPDADLLGLTYDEDSWTDLTFKVSVYDYILIVDFSLPVELLQKWTDLGVNYQIIDHHAPFLLKLNEFYKTTDSFTDVVLNKHHVTFDVKECGATLTWKTLFPYKPMPVFLEYIRDRDLFTKQLPYTDEIHCGMASIRRSFSLYDQIEYMDRESLWAFLVPIGSVSLEKRRKKIQKIIDRDTEFKDALAIVDYGSSEFYLRSDVAETILKTRPKILGVIATVDEVVKIRLSVRHDINALELFSDFANLGGHQSYINFDKFTNYETVINERLKNHLHL
jgi:hypothetical protein